MKLQRFFKDLSWWSKVFTQAPLSPIPDFPQEVLDAVQPTFDFLGSSRGQTRSFYNIASAGSAVCPYTTPAIPAFMSACFVEQAIPVPADEIWFVNRLYAWQDDVGGQWGYWITVARDGVSWFPLTDRISMNANTLYTHEAKVILPPGCKMSWLANGPLMGGAHYHLGFQYFTVKVGETLSPEPW